MLEINLYEIRVHYLIYQLIMENPSANIQNGKK